MYIDNKVVVVVLLVALWWWWSKNKSNAPAPTVVSQDSAHINYVTPQVVQQVPSAPQQVYVPTATTSVAAPSGVFSGDTQHEGTMHAGNLMDNRILDDQYMVVPELRTTQGPAPGLSALDKNLLQGCYPETTPGSPNISEMDCTGGVCRPKY